MKYNVSVYRGFKILRILDSVGFDDHIDPITEKAKYIVKEQNNDRYTDQKCS